MPSSNDDAFHAEDTPDEVKGNKASRKKQKKKAAKQRVEAEDDSSNKDSSSEGPHFSPDLAPTLNPIAPSPPPSRSPSPPLESRLSAPTDDFSPPPDKAASYLSKVSTLQSSTHQLHPFAPTSEPSPPQDGVMLGQDGSKLPSRLSGAGSPLHAASLSSSPQGGIRLPQAFTSRGFPDCGTTPYTTPATQPMNFAAYKTQKVAYDSPPPHMPQRHFSRLAEFDFSRPAHNDKFLQAGSKGYYCGFDTWQTPKGSSTTGTSSVVVVGFEGGLEIHRVNRHKSEMLARLEGLQGGVIDAKILPCTVRDDHLEHLRPLVACVIHGPVLDRESEQSSSGADIKEYHTFVEIYSMRTWQRISRLYQTQPERTHQSVITKGFTPPPPIGNLSIAAEGRFILVTSGISGEIYVFAARSNLPAEQPFCCLGKYWSSLKIRMPSSDDRYAPKPSDTALAWQKSAKRVVYALSDRWLAIKPPLVSSAQTTLKGTTGPISQIDPMSIAGHASPASPLLNCEVDAPFNDSLISRVAKTTTREIYKGAQQGFQALKTYINRPANPNVDPAYYGSHQSPQSEQNVFPPTHAHSNEPQTCSVEPALVSIIDLEKLLERGEREVKATQALPPTFQLNDGCSFLSFSPSGLSLLATNHIGNESRVWDLTRINDSRAVLADPSFVGTVRLVSRFPRVSSSVVIDAVWTVCGNRIAMVTEKGTVHLYGLQSLEYKPAIMLHSSLPSPGSSPRDELQAPAGGFMSNVRAGWQSIHGLATRPRTGSSGIVTTLGNASIAARYAGGRAVRQGLSKGLGMAAEGAHHIRHAEDNKIRLTSAQQNITPNCVQWQHGKDKDIIATLCNGVLTLWAVKNVSHAQHKKTIITPAVDKTPLWTHALPTMSSDVLPPAVVGLLEPDGQHGACAREGPHGFCIWDVSPAHKHAQRRASSVSLGKRTALIPHQDKETNPPYMPYHRLPTVNLFTYSSAKSQTDEADDAWVFGLPVAASSRVSSQQDDMEETYDEGIAEGDMEGFVGQMDETLRAQECSKKHDDEFEEEKLVDM
ncbi:hypothetical protein E4T39_08337 [Aureobasidium subglaciale]|nr:hypothetical protein E4T39_08337 [Aureobasidium subglaciale]